MNTIDCTGCPYLKECGLSISNMRLVKSGLCQVHNSKMDTVILILEEDEVDFLIDEGLWNDCEQIHNDFYNVPKWIHEKLKEFWESKDID